MAIVEKCGGRIRYDFDPQPLDALRPPKRPDKYQFLRKLFGDDYFDTVFELRLGDDLVPEYAINKSTGALAQSGWRRPNGTLGDDDFKSIATLNKLRVLWITNSALTDRGTAKIDSLTDLEDLQLVAPGITDRVADRIARLSKLRRLTLKSPEVTDAAVERIGSIKTLQEVNLMGTRVSREGLNRLHQLLPNAWVNH